METKFIKIICLVFITVVFKLVKILLNEKKKTLKKNRNLFRPISLTKLLKKTILKIKTTNKIQVSAQIFGQNSCKNNNKTFRHNNKTKHKKNILDISFYQNYKLNQLRTKKKTKFFGLNPKCKKKIEIKKILALERKEDPHFFRNVYLT